MKKLFFLCVCAVLGTSETYPQLSLDAVLRPRTEFRHGYNTLMDRDEQPAFFTSQRTRLNFGYDKDAIRFLISLQDVRTWGNTPQLGIADGLTSLHQAWAEADFLGGVISLRLGRQELIYDNQRLFGNVEWSQQGRTHDLALVKIRPGRGVELHVGLAYNQDRENVKGNYYATGNYKTLQYAWAHKDWNELGVSLLVLNSGLQYRDPADNAESTLFSQTLGTYAGYRYRDLELNGSAYYQTGRDASNRKLGAFQISMQGIYPFREGKWETLLGLELLSGTDQETMNTPGNDRNSSFSPFFGTNHKFNGHMDYFYAGNHLNNVGLLDIQAGAAYNPGPVQMNLVLHQFSSAALLLDPSAPGNTMGRYLGTEIDFYAAYKHSDQFSVYAGYSQMFAGRSMEVLKAGGDRTLIQNWAWIMLNFTPKFLQSQGAGSDQP